MQLEALAHSTLRLSVCVKEGRILGTTVEAVGVFSAIVSLGVVCVFVWWGGGGGGIECAMLLNGIGFREDGRGLEYFQEIRST